MTWYSGVLRPVTLLSLWLCPTSPALLSLWLCPTSPALVLVALSDVLSAIVLVALSDVPSTTVLVALSDVRNASPRGFVRRHQVFCPATQRYSPCDVLEP